MAKFGRIKRYGNRYKDMETGRFISPKSPAVQAMREMGAYGASMRKNTRIGNKLRRAAYTIAERTGNPFDEHLQLIQAWQKEHAYWLMGGMIGDEPQFPSP